MNQYELCELLDSDIEQATIWYDENTETDWIKLRWVQTYSEMAILRYDGDNTFTVMISRTADMWKDATISVDEILDIVL